VEKGAIVLVIKGCGVGRLEDGLQLFSATICTPTGSPKWCCRQSSERFDLIVFTIMKVNKEVLAVIDAACALIALGDIYLSITRVF